MTRVIRRGKTRILIPEVEKVQQCDLCGEIAELRPYGPNGEAICFSCGMKHISTTAQKFVERLGRGDSNDGGVK